MNTVRRSFLLISIMILTVTPASAFQCAQTTFSLEYGFSWALAATGDYAAIDAGNAVLIFDLSTPAEPKIIAEHRFEHRIDVMAWTQDTLLVGGFGLLHVIDVSDPASPALVGSAGLPSTWARGIAIDGTTAYVTGGLSSANGLVAIDVSRIDHPVEIGRFVAPGSFQGIRISDGLAYIADFSHGLLIVDVSDPSDMTSMSALGLSRVVDVAVTNGVAFLKTGWGETIYSVDVSTPASPFMLSMTGQSNEMIGGGMIVADDLLYVGTAQCWECSSGGGLSVYNIENPSAPVKMTSLNFGAGAKTLVQLGSHLIASDWKRGFSVIDLEQPEEPVVIAHHDVTFDEVFAIEVQDDLAFLGDRGLRILDLSNEGAPTIIASIEDSGSTRDVAVEQDLAVILNWQAMVTLVNIADPESPAVLARFEPEFTDPCEPYYCGGYDVELAGNLMVIAAGTAGAQIVDISDPNQPNQLADISSPGATEVAEMTSNRLYLGHRISGSGTAGPSGVVDVIDISLPAEPLLLATVSNLEPITDIVASGDHLLILDSGALRILDISEPSNPVEIGWTDAAWGGSLAVDSAVVYLASRPGRVSVVDISDRSHPRFAGRHVWQPWWVADGGPLGGFDVAVHDNLALIADGMWGLRIVDMTRCLEGPRHDPLIEVLID